MKTGIFLYQGINDLQFYKTWVYHENKWQLVSPFIYITPTPLMDIENSILQDKNSVELYPKVVNNNWVICGKNDYILEPFLVQPDGDNFSADGNVLYVRKYD